MEAQNQAPLSYTPEGLRGSQKAEAIIELIFRFLQHDLSALQYYDFDRVHPSYLPHLIRQFALEELADFVSLGESGVRELLKIAVELHRFRGTPWSFDKIFALVGATIELTEWWGQTPKGEPYTAEIRLWLNENPEIEVDLLDPETLERLTRLLRAVAPASRLLSFRLGVKLEALLNVYGLVYSVVNTEVSAPYDSTRQSQVTTAGFPFQTLIVNLTAHYAP